MLLCFGTAEQNMDFSDWRSTGGTDAQRNFIGGNYLPSRLLIAKWGE